MNFLKQNWIKIAIGILILLAYVYLLFLLNNATQKQLRAEAEGQCYYELRVNIDLGTHEGGRLIWLNQCVKDKLVEWNR